MFNVTVSTTSLTFHFKPNYYSAGSPPHGHEIVVWAVNEGSGPGPFSHYFELSVLEAVVKNLQPGTYYTLYVRANGTHFANNQGRWTAQSVTSLPVGGCMHSAIHTYYISGELIVSRYVAESITMIAGRFGYVGLCQLRTKLKKLQRETSYIAITGQWCGVIKSGCLNDQ